MFEIEKFAEEAECLKCDKATECLVVKCRQGTLSGPVCAKCLVRECRKRAKNQPGVPNGQQVTQ